MTAAQPVAHPASASTPPGFNAVTPDTPDTPCHTADIAYRPDAISVRLLPKPRVRLP